MSSEMGMGFDSQAVHHAAAFAECSEPVLMLHLTMDHDLPAEAMVKEMQAAGSLIMLHMTLHGHVIQVDTDPEENI